MSELFDWYIFENVSVYSAAHRNLRFGPFTSENECRDVLASLKCIPRFHNSKLDLHKRPRQRHERIRMDLAVRLCRCATDGSWQTAHTIDISRSGARLGGLAITLTPGEVVEIHCGPRKAIFQVVWIDPASSSMGIQVGVECLVPEVNIWGLHLPESDEELVNREIALAHSVQARLLPQQLPPLRSLNYIGHCIQVGIVGGDYYDFLPLGPTELVFVMADIAGKGMGAALQMANLHGILHAQSPQSRENIQQLLTSVNQHIYQHTEPERYTTLFFGCYSDITRKLRYVNCGHPPAVILRSQGGVDRLGATATVLGLFPDWSCDVAETKINPGDVLAIYTDGITETTDTTGAEFGEHRLLSALEQSRNSDPATMLHNVEHTVEQFRSGIQHDDLTLVIAQAR